MIKQKGDHIELNVIVEKFKKKITNPKVGCKFLLDENGKKIKEQVDVYSGYVIVPTCFYRDGITLYGKSLNNSFKISKTRSTVYDKFTNKVYLVKHTIDEIEESIRQRPSIGFKIGK